MFGDQERDGNITYRAAQFARHLIARESLETDSALRALLTPAEWELVSRLSPEDRRHALSVHADLVQSGHRDPGLLKAALLHDVGKADATGRVNVMHRVARVLLGRFSPVTLARFAEEHSGWFGHGLFLALNHARLGAELARDAGASERTCWLIAHHDDGTISDDADLAALRSVDDKE